MKKEITYDKPRIPSTIVIGIILLVALFFGITLSPITWTMVKEMESSGSVTGDIVAAFVVALGVVLSIVVYAAITVAAGVCLIFALKNRHSTLKPVRIINYVYDGIIAALLILSIVKFIMFGIGV